MGYRLLDTSQVKTEPERDGSGTGSSGPIPPLEGCQATTPGWKLVADVTPGSRRLLGRHDCSIVTCPGRRTRCDDQADDYREPSRKARRSLTTHRDPLCCCGGAERKFRVAPTCLGTTRDAPRQQQEESQAPGSAYVKGTGYHGLTNRANADHTSAQDLVTRCMDRTDVKFCISHFRLLV
jgi:hypothetical protein